MSSYEIDLYENTLNSRLVYADWVEENKNSKEHADRIRKFSEVMYRIEYKADDELLNNNQIIDLLIDVNDRRLDALIQIFMIREILKVFWLGSNRSSDDRKLRAIRRLINEVITDLEMYILSLEKDQMFYIFNRDLYIDKLSKATDIYNLVETWRAKQVAESYILRIRNLGRCCLGDIVILENIAVTATLGRCHHLSIGYMTKAGNRARETARAMTSKTVLTIAELEL